MGKADGVLDRTGLGVNGSRVQQLVPPVGLIALFVGGWEAFVRLTRQPVYLLPAPTDVIARLLADAPFLASQALTTLFEAAAGLLLGGALAVTVGAAMAASRTAERGFYPLAILIKVTPAVALAPLLIVWLGFGPAPKIVVAALISFFPFLVATISGLRSADPGALELVQSLGASSREIFLKVRLPWALPHLFAALRVAVGLALVGAMVAEWLGADRGLGHVIMQANANLDMPGLFAAVVVVALVGSAANLLVGAAERRALHWHPAGREP